MRKVISKLVIVLFLLIAGAVEWKLAYDNFGALDPMPVGVGVRSIQCEKRYGLATVSAR